MGYRRGADRQVGPSAYLRPGVSASRRAAGTVCCGKSAVSGIFRAGHQFRT